MVVAIGHAQPAKIFPPLDRRMPRIELLVNFRQHDGPAVDNRKNHRRPNLTRFGDARTTVGMVVRLSRAGALEAPSIFREYLI
jgi:hypothetical protein